jgi:hypothetical protein
VLEALALGEAVPSSEKLQDDTLPDEEGMERHAGVIHAFKVSLGFRVFLNLF